MPDDEKWYSIKVEAIISLLPTDKAGRKTGITSGYRPNHNFFSAENVEMRMGQITVLNDEWIEPGESKSVIIDFIMPEGYVIDLVPEQTWRIQENNRLVGNGKIEKVVSRSVRSN